MPLAKIIFKGKHDGIVLELFIWVCVPIYLYTPAYKRVWACMNINMSVFELYIGSIWGGVNALPGLLVMN